DGCSASSQVVGRNPARVLPAPVAATSSALRPAWASSSISSWCRRGAQPFDSNQRSTVPGSALLFSLIGSLAAALFLFPFRLGTRDTRAIMEVRCGPQNGKPIPYDETIRVGEVDVRFVPAGHVLGSAQIVMEYRGERIVVSGDYKRRPDPTCACFVPVPCDVFITEATFGLPVFRHPDTGSEIDRLLHRLHSDPSRCVLVGAYALG